MKTRITGRKATLIFSLFLLLALLTACGGASPEEVEQAVQQALATQSAQEQAPIIVEVVMPTPAPTSTPMAENVTSNVVLSPTLTLEIEGFDGPIILSGWAPKELSPNGDWYAEHTANDTWESVAETWKRASEGCSMPLACNVYGPSGVLGAELEADLLNPSAVDLNSMWHGSPDNVDSEFSVLCPEGSYCDMYALNFGLVQIGPRGNPYITMQIPTCGSDCGQGLLVRNWLSRPGVDLNTTIIVSDYGEPGAASWTEYVVDPSDAEYFSQAFHTDQAINAHGHNNNGSGPGDNNRFYQWVLDLDDMSLSLMLHTAKNGWVAIWTNVIKYGTH